MRTLILTAFLISAGLLCAEEPAPTKAPPLPAPLAAAKVYFQKVVASLNEAKAHSKYEGEPHFQQLHSAPIPQDENEKAALNWLKVVIQYHACHEVHDRFTFLPQRFSISFRIEKLGTWDKYSLELYQRCCPGHLIDPEKTYLGFHYTKPGMPSDPEYHGLIDPDGLKLLMFDGDGGA